MIVPDIDETGAEWEDLREALAENARIDAQENERARRLEWQAITFSAMVADFKREFSQLKLI